MKARRWRCNCTRAFLEGMGSRPFFGHGAKGTVAHANSSSSYFWVPLVLQGTEGELSGLLSPYNGCSLRKFLIGHSELEALTDYPHFYTEQLTEPESVEQVLFSKAGGEWVALTPRATSKPSRHTRPWLGLAGARV